MPEAEHEKGREGVLRAKRLLEGTTRFRISYDAYTSGGRVSLPMQVEGELKHYDLRGVVIDEENVERTDIYIESKDLGSAGNQAAQFSEFLAQAYSATLRARELQGTDPEHNFMWATTCPWKGTGFREVATKSALEAAVADAGPTVLAPGHQIDSEVVELLVERLWVWVISERAEEMVLGRAMRSFVAAKVEDEKAGAAR